MTTIFAIACASTACVGLVLVCVFAWSGSGHE